MAVNPQTPTAGNGTERTPAPRPRRGCAGLFFCILIVLAAIWGACLGVFVWVLDEAESTIALVEDFRPKIGSKVYSADEELLGEFTTEQRQVVSLGEMPLHLQKAFVATEDDRFYKHKGVRLDAIANAALYIFRTGRVRGGSTITQQIVRNIETTKVGLEVSLRRKIKEAIIALQLERKFTKDEILELYLNQIFLGISAYGVEAASLQYYGKSCRDLSLGESALLAGLARNPNRQEPIHNPGNALKRRNLVLGQMLDNELITHEEYEAALRESTDESVITREERAQLIADGKGRWAPNKFKAPYFVRDVRLFLLRQTNKEEVFGDGLEIHTTLDMRIQRAAEETLLAALEKFDAENLEPLKKQGKEEEFIPVSGALVCIDNRPEYRGWVRAMVGGRDFDTEKFNLATQARRQPGSSVKPFVWAAAIHNGFTPSSIIVDEPLEIKYGPRPDDVWKPRNFTNDFQGPITLRRALEKSINVVSIKLVMALTMPVVRSYLRRAGITTPIDDDVKLTLALGTPEVLVIDQCVAYSTFANGGMRYDPIMVREIRDRDGFTLYDYRDFVRTERAMPENVAYVVTYLMQGVAEWGSGHQSKALDRPRAGKTGTTNEYRNAWFSGFTPHFTCTVWMGYKDNRPLGQGKAFAGGRLACPVWTDFMVKVHDLLRLPPRDFDRPDEGITFYKVDRETGLAGGTFVEAFITGTKPPTELPVFDVGGVKEVPDYLLLENL